MWRKRVRAALPVLAVAGLMVLTGCDDNGSSWTSDDVISVIFAAAQVAIWIIGIFA